MNDRDLLLLACNDALLSPDPSTQNGALLVQGSTPIYSTLACNEFPARVRYTVDRWQRPAKYAYIEHAERNAIYSAAKAGLSTHGLTMVCLWAACSDCARGIIQSGIKRLVTLNDGQSSERWDASIAVAMGMLEEAGVEVTYVDGPLGGIPLLRNGELFTP